MYTNVNLAAPIGVLLLLGTALLLALLLVTFTASLIIRKFVLARLTILIVAIVIGSYVLTMLVFSFTSSSHVLARNQEKHFCEMDCHLAYSVADVRRTPTLNSTAGTMKANGVFYVVTVKTRFDETTIGPMRGDSPLNPNPRSIAVIDSAGHRFLPASTAQAAITQAGEAGTPVETPLRPSESYSTVFVFDLPQDVQMPALLINESDWPTHLIIGHENSLAHRKTTFQL